MDDSTAKRRIPCTEADLEAVRSIAEQAHHRYVVVQNRLLVPTGALLKLHRPDEAETVAALLEAAGYTARAVGAGCVAVTGVVSRLEMLRAERARLDAEIARQEQRDVTAAAAL